MTDTTGILTLDCTSAGLRCPNRKRALQFASDLLAEHHPQVSAHILFDSLMERERLGSTGLGEGVAIPHCRLEGAPIMAALIVLDEAVDFDAPDGQPVDLLYVLVVPPEETSAHLDILATLAELFGADTDRKALRSASDAAELYDTFANAIARNQHVKAG
ncbi:MAG: PTS sugar transporter subunit IIA [Pseudomonadales bacterium]|jgi:PTS system nitrogen regulatory IIA component|nr:PTS sugar transporter subunit IIA [Pseudomonadales bacterium]MDP6470843.1 PTS sugar transporter subunit IIA [Pseudomonadales bacterium]MDP6825972.1 PTS sugar transporter subunit IIA [Pseudomonadales bacterium]MDP6972284.1 PTS sugar transporter subunit IIA [Pseudomonadales bacterium]|tara:strand:- start:1321 stop:1800 length:480 start_codon:yes stop_codon:yes gene_type:complete